MQPEPTSGEPPAPSAARSLPASSYPGEQEVFDRLFAAEDRHFWFQARNRVIAASLNRVKESLPPTFRALEIGCGTGNTLRVLQQAAKPGNVVGMDLFFGGLRYARQRGASGVIQADMHQSPFRRAFDLVTMFDVIEHLADDVAALRAAGNLLRPGGRLVLTVPALMTLWSYADEFAGHQRRYRREELSNRLRSAGFEPEYVTYYMVAMFPVMWLKRRLAGAIQRRSTAKDVQELFAAELRVVPIFNGAMRWVLEKEARVIGAARTLPFGTSLLAIAAKDAK